MYRKIFLMKKSYHNEFLTFVGPTTSFSHPFENFAKFFANFEILFSIVKKVQYTGSYIQSYDGLFRSIGKDWKLGW